MIDAPRDSARGGFRLDPATLVQAAYDYHREGRPDAAAECCETALAQSPDHAGALHLLGMLRVTAGRAEAGIALLRRAAVRAPDDAGVWYNLGVALLGQDRRDQALDSFRRILDCKPADAARLDRLGTLFGDAGRLPDAALFFRRAVALEPGFAGAHGNLGIALQRLGEADAAIACFRRQVALAPADADGHFRLGVALGEQNRLGEAVASYRAMLALRPDDHRARFNMALLLLRGGDFAAGWPEYECRWQTGVLTPSPHAAGRPQWRGEKVPAGTTLLLHAEQGFGDALQCLRYLPLLRDRGFSVLLEVPAGLKPLLAGVARTITPDEDVPPFDLHCPMLSLPLACATRVETIPPPLKLAAPADRLAAWAPLTEPADRLRVGVAWSGNADHPNDRARSIPLALFRDLLALPRCRFFSLQPELRAADEAEFAQIPGIVDCRGRIADFADTAALVSQLDLVVTADTAAAHLAGAIGKPVWVLLPFAPDWRWLLRRDDSPWYPTARLFRQDRPGDWSGVLARVRAELQRLPR